MAYTRTLSWARPPKSTAAHRPMVGMRQFSEIHRRGDASGAAGAAGQQAPAPGTFGSALPAHDAGHDERLFTTTSGDFYASKVELARTQGRPPPEQADDARFIGGYPACINPNDPAKGAIHSAKHSFHKKSRLHHDTYDQGKTYDTRGRAGQRGGLVRRPDETGAKVGASVWADEYIS